MRMHAWYVFLLFLATLARACPYVGQQPYECTVDASGNYTEVTSHILAPYGCMKHEITVNASVPVDCYGNYLDCNGVIATFELAQASRTGYTRPMLGPLAQRIVVHCCASKAKFGGRFVVCM